MISVALIITFVHISGSPSKIPSPIIHSILENDLPSDFITVSLTLNEALATELSGGTLFV